MGGITSKILIPDPQIGNAVWLGFPGGVMLPPYWWVAAISFQIPFLTTYGFVRHSVAGEHRWVVAGCGTLVSLVGMFQVLACTTDPGIIPRAETEANGNAEWAGAEVMGMRVRERDRVELDEDGEPVVFRWCGTCRVHRPPRAAHCDTLDVCVEEYDHFCPVVAACVAKRSLRYFMGYLTSCGLLSIWSGLTSWHLLRTECGPGGKHHHNIRGVESMCAFASIGCGAGMWTVLMALFYVHLICTESTQRESFRHIPNPYASKSGSIFSACRALWMALCSTLPKSKLAQRQQSRGEGTTPDTATS